MTWENLSYFLDQWKILEKENKFKKLFQIKQIEIERVRTQSKRLKK